MAPRLIAVAGATGNQGGSVAKLLLKYRDDFQVRALTRDPTSEKAQNLARLGADIVQADLTDASTLGPSLAGCWGVFAVTNFYDNTIKDHPASEEQQGKNLAKAALDAGVQCYIWSTLPSSEELSGGKLVSQIYEGKHQVDSYIQSINLPASFIYTGNFYENTVLRKHVVYDREQDVIEFHQPIIKADTKLAMLWVERDLAAVAYAIFTQWDIKSEQLQYKYLLAADRRVSPAELTAIIQRISGKKSIYTILPGTGWPERDKMFDLYNALGTMYPTFEVPDPNVTSGLGVTFSGGAEEYVRTRLLPALGLEAVS